MTATTTNLVNRIWAATFRTVEQEALAAAEKEAREKSAAAAAAEEDPQAEEAEKDEDDEEEEAAAAAAAAKKNADEAKEKAKGKKGKKGAAGAAAKAKEGGKPALLGAASKEGDVSVYPRAKVGSVEFAVGDAVSLPAEGSDDSDDEDPMEVDGEEAAPRRLGLVMRLWAGKGGEAKVTARLLVHGSETVLGSLASPRELFLSEEVVECSLADVRTPARLLSHFWPSLHA